MHTHYHFIGIAGIGMSGLARLLLQRKVAVSGSDPSSSLLKGELRHLGAEIFDSQRAENIKPSATVVYSTDISNDNPEMAAARILGCKIIHRSELLAQLVHAAPLSLAVTGTHGKTTTTAILTSILKAGWCYPSFACGGILLPEGTNSSGNDSPYFVFEADESDGSMLRYSPYGAIITNLDNDHLNYYGSMEALEGAIKAFAIQVVSKQHLLFCGDDARLLALNLPGLSYGFSAHCNFQITRISQQGWETTFDLRSHDKVLPDLKFPFPGKHLALNAAAACALALQMDIPEEAIYSGLKNFGGVQRRAERLIEKHGILIIDDYAHHPAAIKATLQAIRGAVGKRRILAIYQPHRYSRMATLPYTSFLSCFDSADNIYITDLYDAGEAPVGGFEPRLLCHALAAVEGGKFHHIPHSKLMETLCCEARPHDVIVALGAGNLTHTAHALATHFDSNPPKKWRIGVAFGGPSPEHSVSLLSARFVQDSLCPEGYDIELYGIARSGHWNLYKDIPKEISLASPFPSTTMSAEVLASLQQCDLLFPIMHGPYGEDGIVQGFFEVLNKPYVGCGHRSAAVCMDKVLCKKIAIHHGLLTAPFVQLSSAKWRAEDQSAILDDILQKVALPLIVKPSHIGSSIALGLATTRSELSCAIEDACKADDEILIEKRLFARDIEFAVLDDELTCVLPPGEILTNGKPYDYLDKVGSKGPPTTPCASLPPDWIEKGMEAARTAYLSCGCQGFARVDFLLDAEGNFWFNEINPIPGMTAISLYPQMCQVQGIPPSELMDRLVVHALQRHRDKQQRQQYTPSLKPVGE